MKFIIFILAFLTALACFGRITVVDKQVLPAVNLITKNAGFENGKAGWTSSGTPSTYAMTNTAANVGFGNYSLSYDADADGEYIESDTYTVPSGWKGRNGVACTMYKGASSFLEMNIIDDSANELVSQAFSASTSYTELCVNFIFPSSGTVKARLEAEGNAALGYFDNVLIADANRVNIKDVSSSEEYGTLNFDGKANCLWTKASNDWNDYGSDADCNAPTVTGYATYDDNSPEIKFTNLPPGKYKVIFVGSIYTGYSASAAWCSYRIYDGTNYSGVVEAYQGGAGREYVSAVVGEFSYTTTQSSIVFKLQGNLTSGGGTCNITAVASGETDLNIYVYRYPLESEVAYKAGTTSLLASAYHDTNCTWTETNTSLDDPTGDGTCDFTQLVNNNLTLTSVADGTGNQPQIQFTPTKVGVFEICAYGSVSVSNAGVRTNYALTNGSNVVFTESKASGAANYDLPMGICGLLDVTSTAQQTIKFRILTSANTVSINRASQIRTTWTVKDVSQNFPMPQILNNVESSASGGDRICRANLNCDAGSAITAQSGSCVSSIGNISSGACAVTLATGTFGAIPQCGCDKAGATQDELSRADATTTTNINIYGVKPSDGTDLTSFDCDLICTGAK